MLMIIMLLLAINIAFTFFGINPNLKKAIRSMEATRDTINMAISNITRAKTQIDALSNSLQSLKKTSERSAIEVQLINQQLRLKMEKSRSIVDSLQKEIQKNIEKLNNL
jgi:hypothetical protein